MAGAGTPAVTAARSAGVPFTLHSYHHDAATPSYGEEAAAALGVPAGRVFKTLVTDCGGPVVAVVPVDRSLDLRALAAAMGGKRAVMADAAAAERATGYVLGGISPLGSRKRLPTVVDRSALDWDTVFVSAGRRGLEIELSPADLVTLTAARTATIAR